ncbi:MAG: DEAD/DEAH box helicase, partial [Candidatus Woesearchaeota archaeon]
MQYKTFTLDAFQQLAIMGIEKGASVLVSAPTGTGKTLIADYLIDKSIKEGKSVIYTSPLKALSNQKYNDFSRQYPGKIGLLTGDVSINPKAPILIVTTEIYRNMLVDRDPLIRTIAAVIFDEVHFINDFERGTVWEESIIFSPDFIRFLCLSATIPNATQFASWIQKTKNHEVVVVEHPTRAVPLKHLVYHHHTLKEISNHHEKQLRYLLGIDAASSLFKKKETYAFNEILDELQEESLLPALYFCFSRKDTETLAKKAQQHLKPLLSKEKRQEIMALWKQRLSGDLASLSSTKALKTLLSHGIGFHHAGLLPAQKEVVERAFENGLCKLLFATETFALGINMPARTVCFHSLRKWDGRNFRVLNAKEYFQMAGRAGRRGTDKEGHVIIPSQLLLDAPKVIDAILQGDHEPIESQFKLSYNTVMNLLNHYDDETIKQVLEKSFYAFQKKQMQQLFATFMNMKKTLVKKGYVDAQGFISLKGKVLSRIYTQELLITELLFSEVCKDLSPLEMNLILGTIVFEEKPMIKVKAPKQNRQLFQKMQKRFEHPVFAKQINTAILKKTFPLIHAWCTGATLQELLSLSNLSEGDLFRYFRQIIDLQEQILHAIEAIPQFYPLEQTIQEAKKQIDRSFVLAEGELIFQQEEPSMP